MIYKIWYCILKFVLDNNFIFGLVIGSLLGMHASVKFDLKYHLEKRKKLCKNCAHCQNVGAPYCSRYDRVLRADEAINCADFELNSNE